jgi:ribosomal protein L40E
MPRGKKSCPKCSTETGPRAFACKNCNYVFVFKPKSKEHKSTKLVKNFDWRLLEKGDKIKVSGGPYFVDRGEFIPMGYRGKFVVESLDNNGICAWGLDKQSGFCHIYMGRDTQNKETKIWKTKHKLIKLTPKRSSYEKF